MKSYKILKGENKHKLYRIQEAYLGFYELLVSRRRYHQYDQTPYPKLLK